MIFSLLTLALAQRPAILIADFEQKDYGKWVSTGKAFGGGPARGTLPNQMQVSGFSGSGLVNTYEGGDGSTGSLTSPKFKIERSYINFLIGGGYHPGKACITLIVDGKVVRSTTGKGKTPQDTEKLQAATWDVKQYQGKTATIQILDLVSGGWGHINIDDIQLSDTNSAPAEDTVPDQKPYTPPKPEPLYKEKFRPQFHFTAKKNWLNDPNGLVYYNGQYHLFYQHNPFGIQWGNMTWGHAVSPDLIHWRELKPALEPDALGTMYSGSAAVDWKNTTGFGTAENPPLVAMYTAAGKPFTQCLAYSLDKGATWTKYAQNPTVKWVANENRDPRIFWHEASKKWVMALYLDGEEFAIYGSPDLKSWKELSRLSIKDSSECPELFPIKYGNKTKWIFYAANFHYLVGDFDGEKFITEEGPKVGEYGNNFYASQTYSDTPDGRRIVIGWMNGQGPMPDMPFNQQMSFPCELTLVKTHEGMQLARNPIKEIEKLYGKAYTQNDFGLSDAAHTIKLAGGQYDIKVAFRPQGEARFIMKVAGQEILVDCGRKEIKCMGKTMPFEMRDGEVNLRVLTDRSSIELFAQGGVSVMSFYLPADRRDEGISIQSLGAQSQVRSLSAHEIKSAW